MVEADFLIDAVIGGGLADVVQNARPVRNRLRLGPWLERVTQREHVAVGTDAGITKQIPGAADGLAALQNDIALAGTILLQVIARADARQPGADDQHVDMLVGHFHRSISAQAVKKINRQTAAPLQTEAFTQSPELRPDMLAAQFPLEPGDRVSARIGTQARQPLGVARTGVRRGDRLRLRLLRRRHLGSVIDRGSGWPLRLGGRDAFEQALYLRFQPLAGKLALKAGNRVPRRVRAQERQTLFVAVARA